MLAPRPALALVVACYGWLAASIAARADSAAPVSPAFQFTVQVGQQDVRQQRGQGAALRRAFLALTIPSDIMPASR
jgi:hypothetical protein